MKNDWQLTTPIDSIVFDCDGTLSAIEGIDELAAMNNVGDAVAELTSRAMNKGLLTEALYAERLQMTQPTSRQVDMLARLYYEHRVHGIEAVMQVLQLLRKDIYVLSAGLLPAVSQFVERFNISPEQCFAVNIYFNEAGAYRDFDRTCPLVNNHGKTEIIEQISHIHTRIAHIGDGMNDFAAHDHVTRFIGFGGVYFRQSLKDKCQYYVEYPSLLSLLPLIITEEESRQMPAHLQECYLEGLAMLQSQLVR